MPAGMAVYVSQAAGNIYSEIHPADPREESKSTVLGVLPTTVFTGKTTRVAVSGVGPMLLAPNVNSPSSGTTLYLDKDTPGYLTTELDAEGAVIRVGTVVAGKLVLDISKVGEIGPFVHPEDSMWASTTEGDLTIESILTGRMGSWVSAFNLSTLDTPPFVDWEYSDVAQNNATVVIQNNSSDVRLRVSNLDMQPKPVDVFPDTHWNKSGNDLIPRSIV
tara:strand:+ start:870 stop:1526 length:657 start_codon:yes stop_codon:yes gene_type:complete